MGRPPCHAMPCFNRRAPRKAREEKRERRPQENGPKAVWGRFCGRGSCRLLYLYYLLFSCSAIFPAGGGEKWLGILDSNQGRQIQSQFQAHIPQIDGDRFSWISLDNLRACAILSYMVLHEN